ncbi:cobyrinate a,c-diamide synthase [Micromonospora echinofusca]|uniref:Cobyrinate a,c-diamide synthase n=1 Tax=Micromonospora echinofusca TaxID=47858 RepID=A0ABS3W042_MICEH|nr:cobyrinate a,c-diamide synthase [Micromonospora echinofusca]MBO4210149.1 cobyrinate a,c-diamide synthase [Micromonospora echinofusca]
MTVVPRVVLSAPSSGHGKTAVAVGLLAAFAARGLAPAAFKIGPDQVDAAYLGLAAGRPGRNLDPRLVGAARIAPLFAHGVAGARIALVEGTMGLYDSVAGRSETESTAAVATALRSPVVLVVDVATMGQSVAALVHGFRAYDELLWLGGVILNRVASDRHGELLREALDDIAVPVLGALGRGDLPPVLPARDRGVVPVLRADAEALRAVQRLGAAVAARVDVDRLAALAGSAPPLPVEPWTPAGPPPAGPPSTGRLPAGPPPVGPLSTGRLPAGPPPVGPLSTGRLPAGPPPVGPLSTGPVAGPRPVVALAGGPHGSYSHPETAELLTAAGAEVVTVDPLRDESLPPGTVALVVGAALPESYAGELTANRRLAAGVAGLARAGRPVLAEGAGLLWLAREVDGQPMCGVLDTTATTRDGVVVGYRTAVAGTDSLVAPAGTRVVGYKCHRAVLSPRAGVAPAWTWSGGAPEGFVRQGVHASQLGLHWAGLPEIARRVVDAAARPERNEVRT